jgi:hypothetical protein
MGRGSHTIRAANMLADAVRARRGSGDWRKPKHAVLTDTGERVYRNRAGKELLVITGAREDDYWYRPGELLLHANGRTIPILPGMFGDLDEALAHTQAHLDRSNSRKRWWFPLAEYVTVQMEVVRSRKRPQAYRLRIVWKSAQPGRGTEQRTISIPEAIAGLVRADIQAIKHGVKITKLPDRRLDDPDHQAQQPHIAAAL